MIYGSAYIKKEITKETLAGTISKLLKTERDLDFLLELRQRELEFLVACLPEMGLTRRRNEQKRVGKRIKRAPVGH